MARTFGPAMIKVGLILMSIIMLCSPSGSVAQDTLLLTNGRYKDLNGLVVHFDQIEIIWQTVRQFEREKRYLKRTGQTLESYLKAEQNKPQYGDTAAIRIRFEKEIREKIQKLSPEEFEKWKSQELVRMKERQLLAEMAGGRKLSQKRKFTNRIQSGQVFSIMHSNGTETIVYSPDTMGFLALDTTPDLDYGIREMRKYIKGQQDGRRHRTNIDAEVGFVSGMLSAGLGNFYGPLGPALGMGIQAIIPVKIQEKACTNPELKDDDAYFDGYNQAAKRKKILNYGLGGVLGLGFGFLLYSGLFQ